MVSGGNKWGAYDPKWYGKDYFTVHPYGPYRDFPQHDCTSKIVSTLLRPTSILDVGCAYGYIPAKFRDSGILAVGMDLSKWCGMQRVCDYVMGTAWALPFKDKAFDLLYCEGVLEHIPEDSIDVVLKEFSRVSNRMLLFVSPSCPDVDYHLCNHDMAWWWHKLPIGAMMGHGGHSSDIEAAWVIRGRE